MNIFVLDKKKFGIIIIIIGLMFIMFATAKRMDGNFKYVALMQSDINSLKEYTILGQQISYKLPEKWSTKLGTKLTNDILYHNDFNSEDAVINGAIEVWNWDAKENLKVFLERSKNDSTKENSYKNYKVTPININNQDAYEVVYSIMASKDVYYRAYEYFVKENDKYVKFAFYVREGNFKENMPTIFKTLVETVKISEIK